MRKRKRRNKRIRKPIITHHRIGVKPYHRFSKSARALRRELNLARYNENHTYDYLFNWGSQRQDNNAKYTFNKESCIVNSSDKVKAFKLFEENSIRVPKWTTSMYEAKAFVFPVMCRVNRLRGGNGIHIAMSEEDLVSADFFTEFIQPKEEFRVQVFRDEVMAWSKKIPKGEYSNKYIRNHDKGYKFSLGDNSRIFSKLEEFSVGAVKALGLDYGAVDVVLGVNGRFYVLEVNTAVGMEGTILKAYTNKFLEVARYG